MANAALALRRVAAGGDHGLRVGRADHVRDQQAFDTGVEGLAQIGWIVARDTHEDGRLGRGGGAHLCERCGDVVRSVLVIDDEGIEAGAGEHVGDGRAAKRQPASYARVTGGEA